MPRPRNAKEASCESKITAELLGFHLCESCSKLSEDCLKKFVDENAREQLKGITEDVAEFKLIIRTTDKLVDVIKEQGKRIEELQQNFNELIKVSIKSWVRTNKKPNNGPVLKIRLKHCLQMLRKSKDK